MLKIPKVTNRMMAKIRQEQEDRQKKIQDLRVEKMRARETAKFEEKLARTEAAIRSREVKIKKHVPKHKSDAAKQSHETRKKKIILHYLSRDLTIDEARKMANVTKFDFKRMIKDDPQFAQECRCTRLVELESYIEEVIGQTMESDVTLLDSKRYSDYVAEKKLRATMQVEKIRYLKDELKHERTLDLLDKQYKDLDIEVEI